MARPLHLVTRFFGSLRPGGPRAVDREWAQAQLLPAELELWQRMPGPDRRHSAGVARRVERSLGEQATRPVLAAALLHDVGKLDAHLRTYGRVVATLARAASSVTTRPRSASGPSPPASPAGWACTCCTPSSAPTC